jgi:hypothetical protein
MFSADGFSVRSAALPFWKLTKIRHRIRSRPKKTIQIVTIRHLGVARVFKKIARTIPYLRAPLAGTGGSPKRVSR